MIGTLRFFYLEAMARRVLIVDDNAELREGLKELLEKNGLKVAAAATLADAESELRGGIDLIVLDFFIAGFSGAKFLERLKSDPSTSGIPVLVCSGSADDATLQGLVRKGAAAYFRKPFKTDHFLDKVRSLLT